MAKDTKKRRKMYNISNEDRQELLKYLSTQPYANVFKLVAMIVGLKKAPEGKNSKEKKKINQTNERIFYMSCL